MSALALVASPAGPMVNAKALEPAVAPDTKVQPMAAAASSNIIIGAALQISRDIVTMFEESWQSYSDFLSHTSLAFDSMPPNLTPIN